MPASSVSQIIDDKYARVILHHTPEGNHIIHCDVRTWSKSCLNHLKGVMASLQWKYPVIMAAFKNTSTKNMKFALMFDGELIGTVEDLNVYKFTRKDS